MSGLPHLATGLVVKGFGRGSKELGIPTANFSEDVVKLLPESIGAGIYCGWAKIRDEVHKMVISIGWNPYYKNKQKSMETHIMTKFDDDFYGETLQIIIVKFLRPEKSFNSLDALIEAINNDIKQADTILDKDEYMNYKDHSFFQ